MTVDKEEKVAVELVRAEERNTPPEVPDVSISVVAPDSKNVSSQNIATAGSNAGDSGRVLVATSDTIPPKVLWQKENRSFTDKIWGILYILCFVAFLSCGLVIVFNSKPRYERDDATNTRIISPHYQADVLSCCQARDGGNNVYYDLCDQLEASDQRKLRAGESKFDGDEGIFDAFLEAPQIIVGLLALTATLAISWVVLLRFFARPIVIATEIVKIALFIYMGVVQEQVGTRVFSFFIAFGILAYDVWARKSIMFAAKIITHSTKAMRANPSMFLGCIFVTLFYVLNAYLFVLFFSRAFDVVEVRSETVCYGWGNDNGDECYTQCVFRYPSYVGGMSKFLGFAYLWSILLFTKMRLSLIATIVGSWHFHPDDKPSVWRAIINTTTSSVGTLAVSSLISTAAERVNRIMQEPCWRSYLGLTACVTLPIQLFMCLFGQCISTFIRMLTKFSVIMHVFTGLPFVGSAKKVFKILSRHFKGGFVTELTSRGVLSLGAYVFSIGIAMLAWFWFDREFDCNTLPGKGGEAIYAIGWIILGLFNLWYPVLGVYLIILVDRILRSYEGPNGEHYQHLWVAPLAAIFVGCIAMLFFQYLGGIFLDTIDVLFLCFAVDKDNNVDMSEQEIHGLVKSMPAYSGVHEVHIVEEEEGSIEAAEDVDVEASLPSAIPVPACPAKVG